MKRSTIFSLSLFFLFLASTAQAVVTSTGDVDPTDPTTWNDWITAYIGKTSMGSVSVDAGSEIVSGDTHLGDTANSTGTVTIDGSGSKWTSGPIYIGQQGTGQLDITDGGTMISANAWLGYSLGSKGVVNVSGSGSTWTSTNEIVPIFPSSSSYIFPLRSFYVGFKGEGEMHISDGAQVSCKNATIGDAFGSNGIVTVTGPDSRWSTHNQSIITFLDERTITTLFVGRQGTAQLDIDQGATVTAGGCSIGNAYGAKGTVNVSGAGSTWITNDEDGYLGTSTALYVGQAGEGHLNITDGASVTSEKSSIGYSFGSTGTVTIAGSSSSWNIDEDLHVGRSGTGSLHISDGAVLNCANSTIGDIYHASGTVTVSGSGSIWNSDGELLVGHQGAGQLTIADGAEIHVTKKTWVGADSHAIGTITFDDGTLSTISLSAAASDLRGTGTIETHGLLCDIPLQFNAARGPAQTLTLNDRLA